MFISFTAWNKHLINSSQLGLDTPEGTFGPPYQAAGLLQGHKFVPGVLRRLSGLAHGGQGSFRQLTSSNSCN